MVDVGIQTIWSLPITDHVANCPLPNLQFGKVVIPTAYKSTSESTGDANRLNAVHSSPLGGSVSNDTTDYDNNEESMDISDDRPSATKPEGQANSARFISHASTSEDLSGDNRPTSSSAAGSILMNVVNDEGEMLARYHMYKYVIIIMERFSLLVLYCVRNSFQQVVLE